MHLWNNIDSHYQEANLSSAYSADIILNVGSLYTNAAHTHISYTKKYGGM